MRCEYLVNDSMTLYIEKEINVSISYEYVIGALSHSKQVENYFKFLRYIV